MRNKDQAEAHCRKQGIQAAALDGQGFGQSSLLSFGMAKIEHPAFKRCGHAIEGAGDDADIVIRRDGERAERAAGGEIIAGRAQCGQAAGQPEGNGGEDQG